MSKYPSKALLLTGLGLSVSDALIPISGHLKSSPQLQVELKIFMQRNLVVQNLRHLLKLKVMLLEKSVSMVD
jgi:hypothetical protein